MLESILRAPATASAATPRRTCCATTSACASTARGSIDGGRGARAATPLTYFEFGTLAALWLFARAAPDALVLEVGLGGRLDAVNVVDADCAVRHLVDLDHVDYLGGDRESDRPREGGHLPRGPCRTFGGAWRKSCSARALPGAARPAAGDPRRRA
jgi:hypothetical protein